MNFELKKLLRSASPNLRISEEYFSRTKGLSQKIFPFAAQTISEYHLTPRNLI
ncbi:hypothetical protein HMPREF0653_01766 [Prevotella disiens JCM 6334 = ATCC 29426]|uniref:Uncharacterized protein n=1 Tax=Prevotella disiens JCM 6334 = ATCC 29426 TaxID=1235811 RepID=A0ABP2Y628_9BACT|nr:hypothetical protein HMPREF0653_01766 [Prevotella disiens JCM 6334 = ATCC 29426]